MSQAHTRSPIWLGAWAAGDSIGPGCDGGQEATRQGASVERGGLELEHIQRPNKEHKQEKRADGYKDTEWQRRWQTESPCTSKVDSNIVTPANTSSPEFLRRGNLYFSIKFLPLNVL